MRSRSVAGARLELVRGDITQQETDAIVNAANTTLLGGGGVDGAIHRSGGPAILAECRRLGGCATGDARLTGGGRLRARHVIHAVGPVYRDGAHGEAELLASAYRRSLEVAAAAGLRSVAFPSISTGAYRFPIREAARIALDTVGSFLLAASGEWDPGRASPAVLGNAPPRVRARPSEASGEWGPRRAPPAGGERRSLSLGLIRFVLFSDGDLAVYESALGALDVGER